jgi:hypothetical protein
MNMELDKRVVSVVEHGILHCLDPMYNTQLLIRPTRHQEQPMLLTYLLLE